MSQNKYSELSISVLALKAEGQSYEDLFCDIMILKDSRFQKIKAYGNTGDMKNDGYISELGHFFQIYAPENIKKQQTISDSIRKLDEDFRGLHSKWNNICTIKKFTFVVNDKSKGIPPQLSQKLEELKKEFTEIEFFIYDFNSLINDFLNLDLTSQSTIIGYIPSGEVKTIDYPVLRATIENIKNNFSDSAPNNSLNLEEFHNKIEFNNLDESISDYLLKAETQNYLLESYFENNPRSRNFVGTILNDIYNNIKIEYSSNDNISSNIIFYALLKDCCIDKSLDSKNSALVLLSYYFVSCDIFEKPNR